MQRYLLLLSAAVAFFAISPRAHAQASEPFLGQVLIVSFNFAPRGWVSCNGQILPINQNQALFSLLGTTYGGDGRTTFALPDLRGRVPIGSSDVFPLGLTGGEEEVTLTIGQMPAHSHPLLGQSALGTSANPTGGVWAAQSRLQVYSSASPDSVMGGASISPSGGGAPHDNRSPYLAINYIIALQGIFPSRQ
jgi:microcystin-dependent protein